MRTLERLLKKLPRSNSYREQSKRDSEVPVSVPAIGASTTEAERHPQRADPRSGSGVKRADSYTSTSGNNNFSTAPNSPSAPTRRSIQASRGPSPVVDSTWSAADSSLLLPPDPNVTRELSPSPVGSASDGFISERTPYSDYDSLSKDPIHHLYVQEVEVSAPSSIYSAAQKPPSLASTNITAYEPLVAPEAVSQSLAQAEPHLADDEPEIMQRKVWVRRPGASATLVVVGDDDLVDTVRDVILRKYANSLGRSIDSPDINMKIFSRDQSNKNGPADRILGPEESIGQTLDAYYPGGQTIEEALVIEVPQRRTPKPSPRVGNHHTIAYPYYIEDPRPPETARDYFPPMGISSPHLSAHPAHPAHPMQQNGPHLPHSMAVLTTGHLPPLPSPGAHSTKKHRPKYVRQHTSSPTIMHSTQPHSNADLKQQGPQNMAPPAPLPTPPAQADHRPSITPPNPRNTSPHPGRSKRKNKGQSQQSSAKSITGDQQQLKPSNAGLLDGNVPPINILIVEDNPINLRLLEQFMRRLKVRFKTAMNGREAVNTWRTGGFHLVLMDIQLPVMNGLEATKEIRRLESVNGIGLGLVSSQNANGRRNGEHEIKPEDKLADMNLFKSPVIIVALTASSLQSDRHEALAVGCNDFLTKPVGYPWMSRKVTEWGCMQALIDFDGWRQWKASVEKKDEGLTEEQKKLKEKEEKAKQKAALKAMFSKPPPTSKEKSSTKDKKEIAEREPPSNSKETSSKPTVNGNSSSQASRANRNVRGSSGSGMVLETHAEEEAED